MEQPGRKQARGTLGEEHEVFDLTGTAVGEANRPLVGAFVSFAGSDRGSLTNEEGTFRIREVTPGRMELEVERLGYATRSWRGDVGPSSGGLVIREMLEPHEVYLVEVYGQGRHIRMYTNHFMERAARTRLQPVAFLR